MYYWKLTLGRAFARLIVVIVSISLILQSLPAWAGEAVSFSLPIPGQMVPLSASFSPVVLKGIKLDPKNPFRFHFYVDQGEAGINQEQLKTESQRLIKYFLASLTIPEKDLWVNLSPYEKDRIIPDAFGQTEMGRDLLAQDYILKQITASLIYPESQMGKQFWDKVYREAQAKYGTTEIPINTFNKVWIMPEKAVVYENNGVAYVLENHLKVMLEQDYLAMNNSLPLVPSYRGFPKVSGRAREGVNTNALGSQIVREIIIPALTKEVNEGKNFAQLRQVFYSLILATWYKKKIKDSILNKVLSDKKKISGLHYQPLPTGGHDFSRVPKQVAKQERVEGVSNPEAKTDSQADDVERIYQQYLQSFKKGVFNYIKEEIPLSSPPRKYFSGGVVGEIAPKVEYLTPAMISPAQARSLNQDQLTEVTGEVNFAMSADAAMTNDEGGLNLSRRTFLRGVAAGLTQAALSVGDLLKSAEQVATTAKAVPGLTSLGTRAFWLGAENFIDGFGFTGQIRYAQVVRYSIEDPGEALGENIDLSRGELEAIVPGLNKSLDAVRTMLANLNNDDKKAEVIKGLRKNIERMRDLNAEFILPKDHELYDAQDHVFYDGLVELTKVSDDQLAELLKVRIHEVMKIWQSEAQEEGELLRKALDRAEEYQRQQQVKQEARAAEDKKPQGSRGASPTDSPKAIDASGENIKLPNPVSKPSFAEGEARVKQLTGNSLIQHLYKRGDVDLDSAVEFVRRDHPLKEEIFDRLDQMTDDEVIAEIKRVLVLPHANDAIKRKLRSGAFKGLHLYSSISLRELLLHPTYGQEDMRQLLAGLGNYASSELDGYKGDIWVLNLIEHTYLLFRAIEVLSRQFNWDLFLKEDLDRQGGLLNYLIEFGSYEDAIKRFLNFSSDVLVERLDKQDMRFSIENFFSLLDKLQQTNWPNEAFNANAKEWQRVLSLNEPYRDNIEKLKKALKPASEAMSAKLVNAAMTAKQVRATALSHLKIMRWMQRMAKHPFSNALAVMPSVAALSPRTWIVGHDFYAAKAVKSASLKAADNFPAPGIPEGLYHTTLGPCYVIKDRDVPGRAIVYGHNVWLGMLTVVSMGVTGAVMQGDYFRPKYLPLVGGYALLISFSSLMDFIKEGLRYRSVLSAFKFPSQDNPLHHQIEIPPQLASFDGVPYLPLEELERLAGETFEGKGKMLEGVLSRRKDTKTGRAIEGFRVNTMDIGLENIVKIKQRAGDGWIGLDKTLYSTKADLLTLFNRLSANHNEVQIEYSLWDLGSLKIDDGSADLKAKRLALLLASWLALLEPRKAAEKLIPPLKNGSIVTDAAMTIEIDEPQLRKRNPYAESLRNFIQNFATPESIARLNLLKKLGHRIEEFMRKELESPQLKIMIVPLGSTLKGYAAQESDVEYAISVLSGLKHNITEEDREGIFGEINKMIEAEGYPIETLMHALTNVEDLSEEIRFNEQGDGLVNSSYDYLFLPVAYGDRNMVENYRREFISYCANKLSAMLWERFKRAYYNRNIDLIPVSREKEKKRHFHDWLRGMKIESETQIRSFQQKRSLPSLEEMMKIYGVDGSLVREDDGALEDGDGGWDEPEDAAMNSILKGDEGFQVKRPWEATGGLFGFDVLHKMIGDYGNEIRSTGYLFRTTKKVNPWRLTASLEALSDEQRLELVGLLPSQAPNIFGGPIGFLKERILEPNSRHYFSAMELWEDLHDFEKDLPSNSDYSKYFTGHDWGMYKWKGNKTYTDLLKEMTPLANRLELKAHGTRGFFIRNGFNNQWALLEILMEGRITKGDMGTLRFNGIPEGNPFTDAAFFGPYYVIMKEGAQPVFDQNLFKKMYDGRRQFSMLASYEYMPESEHLFYLVPDEAGRAFMVQGLNAAVKRGFLQSSQISEKIDKIITYEDFIMIGRLMPHVIDGSLTIKAALKEAVRSRGEDAAMGVAKRIIYKGVELWADAGEQPLYLKVPEIKKEGAHSSGWPELNRQSYVENLESLQRSVGLLIPAAQERIARGNALLIGPGHHPYEILRLLDLFPNLESITVVDINPRNLEDNREILSKLLPSEMLNKIRFENKHFGVSDFSREPQGRYDLVVSDSAVFDPDIHLPGISMGWEEEFKVSLNHLKHVIAPSGAFVTVLSEPRVVRVFSENGFHVRNNLGKGIDDMYHFIAVKDEGLFAKQGVAKQKSKSDEAVGSVANAAMNGEEVRREIRGIVDLFVGFHNSNSVGENLDKIRAFDISSSDPSDLLKDLFKLATKINNQDMYYGVRFSWEKVREILNAIYPVYFKKLSPEQLTLRWEGLKRRYEFDKWVIKEKGLGELLDVVMKAGTWQEIDKTQRHAVIGFIEKFYEELPKLNIHDKQTFSLMMSEMSFEMVILLDILEFMKNEEKGAISISTKGGIDMNPAQMNLQVKNEGESFHFDFNGVEIDAAQVTGAEFIINDIKPVTNLLMELGLPAI